jgi:hypothetical protein
MKRREFITLARQCGGGMAARGAGAAADDTYRSYRSGPKLTYFICRRARWSRCRPQSGWRHSGGGPL